MIRKSNIEINTLNPRSGLYYKKEPNIGYMVILVNGIHFGYVDVFLSPKYFILDLYFFKWTDFQISYKGRDLFDTIKEEITNRVVINI